MLSRRHLRIKVLQALYAYSITHNKELPVAERELIRSIEKLYELFIYLLSFVIEIFEFGSQRLVEAKLKYLPTQEDLNPNTKFVDNKLIEAIVNNPEYKLNLKKLKISWHDEEEMIRRTYKTFREGKEYREYMESQDVSFNADKNVVLKLLKKYLAGSEALESYLEEKSIYWANDFPIVVTSLAKSLKQIKENSDDYSPIPGFRDEISEKENHEFATNLFRKTILKGGKFEQMIAEKAKNWEIERIALMDMILLKMALTEITDFESIPIKVTFNEYIEISKDYSTPKSKIFINGILDKLIADLKDADQIKKTGRGLVE
jgi:N utilization substance protein B